MIIPEQEFSTLLQLAEDRLARAGYAIVSAETAALGADIERRIEAGLPVSSDEFERFLYGYYANQISEYHQPRVFA
jgi:hypothetical protein